MYAHTPLYSCTLTPCCPIKDDDTPLHWAAMKGHEAVAEVLLKAGAKVDAQNMVCVCVCVCLCVCVFVCVCMGERERDACRGVLYHHLHTMISFYARTTKHDSID